MRFASSYLYIGTVVAKVIEKTSIELILLPKYIRGI